MLLRILPKLELSFYHKERQMTVHNSFLLSGLKILPGPAVGTHLTMVQEQGARSWELGAGLPSINVWLINYYANLTPTYPLLGFLK